MLTISFLIPCCALLIWNTLEYSINQCLRILVKDLKYERVCTPDFLRVDMTSVGEEPPREDPCRALRMQATVPPHPGHERSCSCRIYTVRIRTAASSSFSVLPHTESLSTSVVAYTDTDHWCADTKWPNNLFSLSFSSKRNIKTEHILN